MAGQPQDNMLPAGFSMREFAFDKWARKPQTKAKLAAVKKSAWSQFTKQFLNADKTQFNVETSVDEKYNISAEVFFNEGPGSSQSVWLRQKILEPANEDCTRFDRRSRLSFSAVVIENKKSIANSCGRFHRRCAQPCQNFQ